MIKLTSRYYRTYPQRDPLGHTEEVVDLDEAHTVFLIIDVYGTGFDAETAESNWC